MLSTSCSRQTGQCLTKLNLWMCSYGGTSVCNPPDYIFKCLKYNYLNETTTIKRKAFNKKRKPLWTFYCGADFRFLCNFCFHWFLIRLAAGFTSKGQACSIISSCSQWMWNGPRLKHLFSLLTDTSSMAQCLFL